MSDPIADANAIAARILAGEDPPPEEMRRVLESLRVNRAQIIERAEGKKKASKSVAFDIDSLFDSNPQAAAPSEGGQPPASQGAAAAAWDPFKAFDFARKETT